MNNKILLGTETETKGKLYLEKHRWECDWYWGFGYLDGKNMFFHFDSVVPNESDENKLVFAPSCGPYIEVELKKGINGWELMELFREAYILKDAAELFHRGTAGIMETEKGIKKNPELAKQFNDTLKIILDQIWELVGGDDDE